MLQLIMNNIPHSIFWKDKDLSYLGCNQNFANDAGKESPEEIIGKTDYDMPWLDQAELYRADDRRVMEADEPVLNYEEPQTTPDGGQIWLRTSKVPLHDATGDVMAVLGLYEDVTAEKQAEQILRESEERFRGLYESSPLGIILNDYERGDYLEANDAFLEMMGYTLEELNQLSYFDVTPQKYEADEAEQIRSMEETGRYGPYEKEYIRKDGSIFPVLLNGVLVTDSRGRKLIWSTVADITERVRAEQERERFTNQLRTAADLTEQVNAILDPDQLLGEVVTQLHDRFNLYHVHVYLLETPTSDPLTGGEAGGAQLMMRAGSGEIGQVMLEREHKILLDREQSLVARAARTGEIVHAADTALDADFMPNPLLPETRSEVAVPLMAGDRVLGILDVQDNQPGRFTQSDLDIFSTLAGQISTALQNAGLFEEVQQTAERLREVDRLKSEFLANMSHELRTPLNSILGYTEVMLMGLNGDLDPDTQEDVQAIYDNGQHLLRLINDVLDLAKIEAGRMALNIEDVEIAPLLEDIKTNSAGLLVNKPVEMILEIDEELPSIKADRTRVNQVLTNLVSNAAKFTEQGQVTLRAFCEDDEWICLEVQDTGIGIQEADLESIFEQFRQADGSFKRRAEGTGLGLAITRHLVTMHGGTISVHSQVGSGSTFTVRLPIRSRVVEAISGSSDGQQV
jgi:PAS domain S-box-containing protein